METQNNSKSKRYFWLKLQNNFFERDEIKIIEAMPNGKDYIIFYLKLMLKSINDNGRLIFKDTIPYTPEMLSSITNTSIDTVRVAIDAFVKLGLITLLDDGALYMQEVDKLVGSETADAERKRLSKAKQNAELAILPKKARTKSGNFPEKVLLEYKSIEIREKKEIPYSPQTQFGMEEVLVLVRQKNYQFTTDILKAIEEWLKYKSSRNETLTKQQIEILLKLLHNQSLAKQNIVYLIENSISRGYKGIMEPTKSSLSLVSKPQALSRYSATDYITPENQSQKIELRNYVERCYMRELVDPRTGQPLSAEQKSIIRHHIDSASKEHISFTDYVFRHEVMTGICLLDSKVA